MQTEDIIIGGDANASSIWWGCKADDNRGTQVMETLAELNLEVLNTGKVPTFSAYRKDTLCSSIIDITACTTSLLHKVENWRVDDSFCNLSNHKPILFKLSTSTSFNAIKFNSTRKYNTRKANWCRFDSEFKKALDENGLTKERIGKIGATEEVDEIVKKYTESITKACDVAIPKMERKQIPKAAKWWNAEIKEKKEITIRLRRRISNAHPARKNWVIEQYLEARQQYKKSIEDATTKSWKELCTNEQKENVWQRTYRILKVCSNIEGDKLLKDRNGAILSEKESATLLAETFYPKDSSNTDTEKQNEIRIKTKELIAQLANNAIEVKTPFARTEIHQILSNMNAKKAPGEDGLTSEICQAAYNSDPEVLELLYNKCLQLGYFPKTWKKATIKIIPKPSKEDYTNPKAYRLIGLLPVLGKILEKLFTNRVQWQLGKDEMMNQRQYGFTPQRSTEDALYDTITLIKNGLRKKEIVILVSLDIEGAFDNAWWPAIITELRNKQVEPTATENSAAHVHAFADDILIIASNKDGQQLEKDVNDTLKIILEWGDKTQAKICPT
ncbi:unnamed protein product [Parnassius mnemosyne]|uniref:Reverse transcriptase domain-containing protein n=1 Tax=Parnassius mnemosyne TaxID=213953 RepID=A0AAV1L4J8_9NEOP